MQSLSLFSKTVVGEFISRPNRFLTVCRIHGKTVEAYLPNPGRLLELFFPGVRVWFVPSAKIDAKQSWVMVAVERKGLPVMLHTHRTNDVAQWLLEHRCVPGLEQASIIQREVPYGRHRFDFLLEDTKRKIYLEVKSCTLFSEHVAMFPDAITTRGRSHLETLAELRGSGQQGAVLFVVHSSHVHAFMPDFHTDPEFARTLNAVRQKVEIVPLALDWRSDFSLGPSFRRLPVLWPKVARHQGDRGAYFLVLKLSQSRKIRIGQQGIRHFPPGYYVYTGSALGGLSARIARHRRLHKKKHWHIDFLREHAEWIACLPVCTPDDLECKMAQDMIAVSEWGIPGFGCTDCTCATHLTGFSMSPLQLSSFHEIVFYYRADRLVGKKRLMKKIQA